MSMRDRRDLERFALDCVAVVTVTSEDGLRMSETRVRDISASGAFVYMEPVAEVGARVEVELHLVIGGLREILRIPEDVRVHVHGHIVRSNHHGVGVLFEHPLRFAPSDSVPAIDEDRPDFEDVSGGERVSETGDSSKGGRVSEAGTLSEAGDCLGHRDCHSRSKAETTPDENSEVAVMHPHRMFTEEDLQHGPEYY